MYTYCWCTIREELGFRVKYHPTLQAASKHLSKVKRIFIHWKFWFTCGLKSYSNIFTPRLSGETIQRMREKKAQSLIPRVDQARKQTDLEEIIKCSVSYVFFPHEEQLSMQLCAPIKFLLTKLEWLDGPILVFHKKFNFLSLLVYGLPHLRRCSNTLFANMWKG